MEIVRYIRQAGRAAWLLVLVPVLLLLVAVPWALLRASDFVGEVTVVVEPPTPEAGPAAVRQGIDSFVALATAEQVRQRVAERTSVPAGDIAAGLEVQPQGTSNLVEVSYTDQRAADAEAVPPAVAETTLELFRATGLELAELDVTAFTESYEAALAESREFAGEAALLPEDEYRVAVDRQRTVQDALAEAGETESEELAAATATLETARDRLLQARLLQAAVDRASAQLAAAQARQTSLQVRADSGTGAQSELLQTTVRPVDATPFVLQVAVGAVVVGVVLAAAVLVGIEGLRRSRRRDRPHPAGPRPTTAGTGPGTGGAEPDAAPGYVGSHRAGATSTRTTEGPAGPR